MFEKKERKTNEPEKMSTKYIRVFKSKKYVCICISVYREFFKEKKKQNTESYACFVPYYAEVLNNIKKYRTTSL